MRCFAYAAAAFLLALPASGQEVPPRILEMFPPGQDACYGAKLSGSGLKSGQTLSEFYLYRSYEPNPALEEIAMTREEATAWFAKPGSGHWLDVIARFSDKPFTYSQSVSCWAGEGKSGVRCGADCDGGSFSFAARDDGITLGVDKAGGGLSLNQSCGEPDDESGGRWMTPQEAGETIALAPQPAATCIAEDRAARPAFAADPVPLRERIAASNWRCLRRSYDKAHLARHPKQKVTAIAVAIRASARLEAPGEDYPSTVLDVALSFRLRDGSVKTKDAECRASQYEFLCEGFRLRRRDGASAWLAAGDYTDPENPPAMLETVLGSDDRLFRLDAGTEARCRAE